MRGIKEELRLIRLNNYSAYKIMKADAGYGMASADENSFVNKKSEMLIIYWSKYMIH